MNLGAVIITCPGREDLCHQTVSGLALSDWRNDHPVHVQNDTFTCPRRQERQERNALAALTNALQRLHSDILLFMEDDLIFNRHLVHNLTCWKPLADFERAGDHHGYFFGSLYDPNIRELEAFPDEHYFIADSDAVYGSQCFVMSRAMAEYFVEHWWEVPGMQDIKMSRLAGGATSGGWSVLPKCPIHYHVPSLVQHVGFKSAWGGAFHQTRMFDADWKHPVHPA
jgi:hypothetical protein